MLQATVQQLEDAAVLCGRGRIVISEAYAILCDTAMSQRRTRLLVLDLAQVDCIDAGGLGVLLGVRKWARANGIRFKLMNVMNRVEQILELTLLDRGFEFCSVRDLFCLLHRAVRLTPVSIALRASSHDDLAGACRTSDRSRIHSDSPLVRANDSSAWTWI